MLRRFILFDMLYIEEECGGLNIIRWSLFKRRRSQTLNQLILTYKLFKGDTK